MGSLPALVSWDHIYSHRKKLVAACKITEVASINESRPNNSASVAPIEVRSLGEGVVIDPLKMSRKIQRGFTRGGHPSDVDPDTLLSLETEDSEEPLPRFIFNERYKNYKSFGHQSIKGLVFSDARPNLVAGWASLDSPGYDPIDAASEEDGVNRVYALWVVTEKRAEPFGLSLGYWLPWNNFYRVLFLRKEGEHLYQRVGVGVLFREDIDRGFVVDDKDFMLA